MLYGKISDVKNKLRSGVRGIDYFVYFDASKNFIQSVQNSPKKPIHFAEMVALQTNLERLKSLDEFIMCKSAPNPASHVDVIETPYKGHVIKNPSTRTYDPVDLGFFNTPSQLLYDFFQSWSYLGSNFNAPDGTALYLSSSDIGMDIMLANTDSEGRIIGGHLLYNAWCSDISQIDFDAGNPDMTEFTVTLQIEKAVRVPIESLGTITVVGGVFGIDVAGIIDNLKSLFS